jgi:hypothetical protein
MSHTHTVDVHKIQALADRTWAFDVEYNTIVVLVIKSFALPNKHY